MLKKYLFAYSPLTDTFGRIFQVSKLGMKLKQDSIPLAYTPRKFITHPSNPYFYLIEGDHRTVGPEASENRLAELVSCTHAVCGIDELSNKQRSKGKPVDEDMLNLPPEVFGLPRAAAGSWASNIRIIDPVEARIPCTPEIYHPHNFSYYSGENRKCNTAG